MRYSIYSIAAAGIAMGIGFSATLADAQRPAPNGIAPGMHLIASGEAKPENRAVGLANPAAVFCIEQGGRYEIRKSDAGSQGFCILPDGAEVDAWTYFREHFESKGK